MSDVCLPSEHEYDELAAYLQTFQTMTDDFDCPTLKRISNIMYGHIHEIQMEANMIRMRKDQEALILERAELAGRTP